jgi:hypothetical protein
LLYTICFVETSADVLEASGGQRCRATIRDRAIGPALQQRWQLGHHSKGRLR